MSMDLRRHQVDFARLVPRLIEQAFVFGFEVTLGDAFRDPRVHGGIGIKLGYGHARSAHKMKLAIDLNLFKDGKYLEGTDAHRQLGEWWEQQHPLARWGGRFASPDGNHYSFEFGGVR